MKIYLVRHGDTQRGANGTYGYGASLSDLGTRQAATTARFMAGLDVTHIVSSDAVRAIQTAEPLQRLLMFEPTVIPELTEIDVGQPGDGVTPYADNTTPDGGYLMDWAHVGGESWVQFRDRVQAGLGMLDSQYEHDAVIAVFTHGGVKNVALDHYSGRMPSRVMHTLFDNGSISTIEIGVEGHFVRSMNDSAHL